MFFLLCKQWPLSRPVTKSLKLFDQGFGEAKGNYWRLHASANSPSWVALTVNLSISPTLPSLKLRPIALSKVGCRIQNIISFKWWQLLWFRNEGLRNQNIILNAVLFHILAYWTTYASKLPTKQPASLSSTPPFNTPYPHPVSLQHPYGVRFDLSLRCTFFPAPIQ